MAGEGTPISDQRSSAAYRTAMLGEALRRLWAESQEPRGRRMSTPTQVSQPSRLSQLPDENVVVGLPLHHEAAGLHVTGHALYTDDLVHRTSHALHAHPVQAPHAHARVTRLDVAPAYDVPGVVRVLTKADVPGVNDSGIHHDEPLFPDEVMYVGHAVCWVLGETLEAARRGAAGGRGRLRAAAVDHHRRGGHRGRELPGRATERRPRRRRAPGWHGRPTCSRASPRSPARSTSTSRRTARWPCSTRTARSSCSRARSTPPRRRRSSPTCSGSRATT